ncbi:MAG: hypothetical protein J6Z11_07480, partial [Candidatus Riflebacteria bacterium]|nr:hypothetical protein [Candidatus Riflebacteria bacterium]
MKKSMSLADSENIYEAFFANLDNADEAWEQFVSSNYDERQTMLENIVESSRKAALQEAKDLQQIAQDSADNIAETVLKATGLDFREESGQNIIQQYEEFDKY